MSGVPGIDDEGSLPGTGQDAAGAAAELRTRALYQRMHVLTLLALLLLQGLLLHAVRAQPGRMGALALAFALAAALHALLVRGPLTRAAGPRTRQRLRHGLHALALLAFGHLSNWAMPAWLLLPLLALWMGREPSRGVRARLALQLGGVTALALLDGASAWDAGAFLLLAALAYGITEARVGITRAAVEALEAQHAALAQAHAQLDAAHARAREQERLSSLGLLAAGIAHEINNPLAFVKSNVHALSYDLQAHKALPAQLQEYVDDVLPETLDGIQRIASIVGELRRFARMDVEQRLDYDLNDEVRAALRISCSLLQGRCELQVELGELPRMSGWPRQMSQVLVNLLVNAAQALPPRGGRIALRTWQEGAHALVRVQDSGAGMSAEVQARLFEPFFTTRPVGVGTGMGLAVVHGIVSAHGGSVSVYSVPGEGSTFMLRLPCAQAPEAPGGAAPQQAQRTTAG